MPKIHFTIQDSFPKLTSEYKYRFIHCGKVFSTGLQAFFFLKNDHNQHLYANPSLYQENRNRICAEKNICKLHQINKMIPQDDKWECFKHAIMLSVVESRLRCVPGFREQLLASGDRILINADPNCRHFGVGADYRSIRWLSADRLEGRNFAMFAVN